jgi:hypothetical protein
MSLVHRKKKKVSKSQHPPSKAELKRAELTTLQQIIDDPTTKPAKKLTALKKLNKLLEKPKGLPRGKPFAAKSQPEPAPVESPAASPQAADGARTPTITEAEPKETPDELRARLGLKTPEQEEAERTARLLMANKIPAMDDDEVLSPGAKRALLDIAGWTHTAAEPIDDGSPANPIRNPGGEQPEPQQPFDPKFDASGMRIMPDITPRWWRRK